MVDQPKLLPARSIQEQSLYLIVHPCQKCQSGPLKETARHESDRPTGKIDAVEARCTCCGEEVSLQFLQPAKAKTTAQSELIDVSEWLALCHHFLDLSQTNSEKEQVQQQIKLARHCLNEALKFYPKDSDLPMPSAFFGRLGGRRFKEHPAAFLKTRLLELRRRLPALATKATKYKPTATGRKRKWWRV